MYHEFSIIEITKDITNKQIIIVANKAINQNNSDELVIEIYERETKTPVLFDYVIDCEKLIITLKDWPIPNTSYILSVKGLKDVIDNELNANIKKRVVFDTTVTSEIKVNTPSMFEEIDDLDLQFDEISEEKVNNYYIEISKDNSFFDVTHKLTAVKNELRINLKDNGQYFLRVRAQKNESDFGKWSDVITFIYGNINEDEESDNKNNTDDHIYVDTDFDEDEPIVDIGESLEIIDYPEQGVTPNSILFAFNNNIDDLSVDDIIVIRKDVK